MRSVTYGILASNVYLLIVLVPKIKLIDIKNRSKNAMGIYAIFWIK